MYVVFLMTDMSTRFSDVDNDRRKQFNQPHDVFVVGDVAVSNNKLN